MSPLSYIEFPREKHKPRIALTWWQIGIGFAAGIASGFAACLFLIG